MFVRRTSFAAAASMCLAVVCQTLNAQETGIYVERYFPTSVNPCFPNSQITPNDGWFAVPGFNARTAWCVGTTAGPGRNYGTNIEFQGRWHQHP